MNNKNSLNPFLLHMLMDGNIADNIGSTSTDAMKNFYEIVMKKCRDETCSDIKKLFDPKNDDENNIYVILNKFRSINNALENIKVRKEMTKILTILNNCLDNLEEIPEMDFMYNVLNKIIKKIKPVFKQIDAKQMYGNMEYAKNLASKFYILAQTFILSSKILSNNEIFLPSGWVSNSGSHLIGIYFKKNINDMYTFVMTNSGDGIENHKTQDDKYMLICEKEVTLEQIKQIVNVYIMGNIIDTKFSSIASSNDSNGINGSEQKNNLNEIIDINSDIDKIANRYSVDDVNNADQFYNMLKNVFNVGKFTDISFSNDDIYYYYPQLSGSCSYYGIFYFLFYYSYKKGELHRFQVDYFIIRKNQATSIIEKFSSKKYISEKKMNIIHLLGTIFNINIDNAVEIYNKNIAQNFIPALYKSKNKKQETHVEKNNVMLALDNYVNDIKKYDNVLNCVKSLCWMIRNYTASAKKRSGYSYVTYDYFINTVCKLIEISNDQPEKFYQIDAEDLTQFLIYSYVLCSYIQDMYGYNYKYTIFAFLNCVIKTVEKFGIINPDVEETDINFFKENDKYNYIRNIPVYKLLGHIKKYYTYFHDKSKTGHMSHMDGIHPVSYDEYLINKWQLNNEDHNRYLLFVLLTFIENRSGIESAFSVDIEIINNLQFKYYRYSDGTIQITNPTYIFSYDQYVAAYYCTENKQIEIKNTMAILLPGEYRLLGKLKLIEVAQVLTDRNFIFNLRLNNDTFGYQGNGHADNNIGLSNFINTIDEKKYDVVDIIIKNNLLTQRSNSENISQLTSVNLKDIDTRNYTQYDRIYYDYARMLDSSISFKQIIEDEKSMSIETFLFVVLLVISFKYTLGALDDKYDVYGLKKHIEYNLVNEKISDIVNDRLVEIVKQLNVLEKTDGISQFDRRLTNLRTFENLCNIILFFTQGETDIDKIKLCEKDFMVSYEDIYDKYGYNTVYNNNFELIVNQIITNYLYINPHVITLIEDVTNTSTIIKLRQIHKYDTINKITVTINDTEYIVYDVINDKGDTIRYLDESHIFKIDPIFRKFTSLFIFTSENSVIIEPMHNSSYYEKNSSLKFTIREGGIDTEMNGWKIYTNYDNDFIRQIQLYTNDFLVFSNRQHLEIIFPFHKSQMKNNTYPYFTCEYSDENRLKNAYYREYNTDVTYEVEKYSLIHNKFTYDISNSYIVKHNNSYKILLISYNNDELKKSCINSLNSPWINIDGSDTKNISEPESEKISKQLLDKENLIPNIFHLIDIHYTGLFLNFTDPYQFYSYFIYCNIKQKMNVLDLIYTAAPQFSNGKNVKEALKYPNTPYNAYFQIKYANISNTGTNSATENLVERTKYYIPKFRYNPVNLHKNIDIQDNFINFIKLLKTDNMNKIQFPENDQYQFFEPIRKFLKQYDTGKSDGEYINCTFNDKINMNTLVNDILKCREKSNNYAVKIYDDIGSLSSFDNTNIQLITENYKIYYALLKYIKVTDICNNLVNIASDSESCNKATMVASVIDDYYVYSGNRNFIIILFEILFGSFIRDDQYKIYRNIVDEISNGFNGGNYNIYQMLMGKGKTSVITPLLIFEYIFNSTSIMNIVIVLPKHLIQQTYDMISSKYSIIMPFTKISVMKIERETDYLTTMNHFETFKKNKLNISPKRVIITDITSLQSIKLNAEEKREDIPFNDSNTMFIFDEIDSLSDPLSNELNYPKDKKQDDEYNKFSRNFIIKIAQCIVSNVTIFPVLDKQDRAKIISSCYKNFLPRILKKFEHLNIAKCGFMAKKIVDTFDTALQKIYNKDYGFDHTPNSFIAIPYAYVNTPLSGSEFSDTEIKMVFTSLAYFIGGLRDADLKYVKSILKKIYNESKEYPFLLKNNKLINLLNIDTEKIVDEKFFDSVEIDRHSKYFITKYLKMVLPNFIKRYSKQYNASFIDVAGNSFSKYKIGFSGTVSGIHMDGILNYDIDKKNIFENIVKDDIAMGAMYSSLIGATQKSPSHIFNIDSEENIFQVIVDILKEHRYDSLIDTGAYLRNYDPYDVVKTLMRVCGYHKKYVFVDAEDKLKYVMNPNQNVKSDMFIYYDQKHTVGIDVGNQPYILKGLITVNYFNRLTDISQGAYRLRKINYGHTVDFLVSNIGQQFDDPSKLVNYLIHQDSLYKNSLENIALLQQIKYILRKTGNGSYTDEIFDELTLINKEDDIEHDNYSEYIQTTYCRSDKVEPLCKNLRNIKINSLQTNVNVDQQISVNTEVSTNLQEQMTRNYAITQFNNIQLVNDYTWIISDYFSLDNNNFSQYNYLQGVNSTQLEYLKKFLTNKNIYLSPHIFSNNFDTMGKRSDVLENNLISHYNYYSMSVDNLFILLKDFEYTIVSNYLRENKIPNTVIRNKNSIIVYDNREHFGYDKRNAFIKYILGGSMNIMDVVICVKYLSEISDNIDEIQNFLQLIEYFMLTLYESDSVHKLYNYYFSQKKYGYDDFIDNLFDKSENTAFLKIFGYNLNEYEKNIILDHYKKTNVEMKGGNKKRDYLRSYIKYEAKYNKLLAKLKQTMKKM